MLIYVLMIALKLPSLSADHLEDDERIYWALAENYLETRTYSLRGTNLLEALPPAIYDKPLFHHPPMLTFLLIPFAWLGAPKAAILVSWLGHAIAVKGITLISWSTRRRAWHGTHYFLWLPILGMALDPVMSFAGRKLWIDNLVGGFCALSVGMACYSVYRRSTGAALASGVFAAFAVLSKLTGVLAVPAAVLVLWLNREKADQRRTGDLIAFAIPFVVLIAPWFVVFYREYGVLVPDWIKPDAALLAMSPHMARVMERGAGYFPVQTLFLAPAAAIVTGVIIGRWKQFTQSGGWPIVVWLVVGHVGLIWLQVGGHGAHFRFLTPVTPAWYMAMAWLMAMSHPRRSLLGVGLLLSVMYSVSTTGVFLVNTAADDVVTVPEILWNMWTGTPPPN